MTLDARSKISVPAENLIRTSRGGRCQRSLNTDGDGIADAGGASDDKDTTSDSYVFVDVCRSELIAGNAKSNDQ